VAATSVATVPLADASASARAPTGHAIASARQRRGIINGRGCASCTVAQGEVRTFIGGLHRRSHALGLLLLHCLDEASHVHDVRDRKRVLGGAVGPLRRVHFAKHELKLLRPLQQVLDHWRELDRVLQQRTATKDVQAEPIGTRNETCDQCQMGLRSKLSNRTGAHLARDMATTRRRTSRMWPMDRDRTSESRT